MDAESTQSGITVCYKGIEIKLTRGFERAVLNRKNAYFSRNETGAKIADILMSVMETRVLNNVNPQNFLIAIQKHQEDVYKNPTLWLPWLYVDTLKS